MENFICKVANREELLKRWDYLIKIHPGNNKWVKFKENALSPSKNTSAFSLSQSLPGPMSTIT